MGEARDVMDRATAAIFSNDMAAIAECYAADVVAQTPDAGTINGRDDLVDYMRQMSDAFPDLSYEMTRTMEDGRFACGRSMWQPSRGGVITSHDIYFDQMAFVEQLGLMQQGADA